MDYNNTDTYDMNIICNNCGHEGVGRIDKGVEVSDVKCPKCGCKMLRKRNGFYFGGML